MKKVRFLWKKKQERHIFCQHRKILIDSCLSSSDFDWKHLLFNPRPAGPLNFSPPAGGGGGALERPLLSRLLDNAARRSRRRSKARQKSWRSYFCHFFDKVKNDVTRSQKGQSFETSTSLDKSVRSSETRNTGSTRKKKTLNRSFNALSTYFQPFWDQVNGLASIGHERSK